MSALPASDLDLLPATYPSRPTLAGPTGRKCSRHRWDVYVEHDMTHPPFAPCLPTCVVDSRCGRCGAPKIEARVRGGASGRRLGVRNERRIERLYGPVKRGELGDAVDLLGRDWKWQSRATRAPIPRWLATLQPRSSLPAAITEPLAAMEPIFRDHVPLVVRSFVRNGVPTRDWIFVMAADWQALHSLPCEGIVVVGAYAVMTGETFLELNGRDEPATGGTAR